MVGRPQQLKTVGHITREISRLVYFFLTEENGQIDGTVHSVNYRPSPIPAGGFEIPLILNFKSHYITHIKMQSCVLCSFVRCGTSNQIGKKKKKKKKKEKKKK